MPQERHPRLPAERTDEIPTNPSVFKACVISVAVFMLGGLAVAAWLIGLVALAFFLQRNGEVAILFEKNQTTAALALCFLAFGGLGAVSGLIGLISFWRNRVTYQLVRFTLMAVYLVVAAYLVCAWKGAFSILDADIEVGGSPQDRATILVLWWKFCWPGEWTIKSG